MFSALLLSVDVFQKCTEKKSFDTSFVEKQLHTVKYAAFFLLIKNLERRQATTSTFMNRFVSFLHHNLTLTFQDHGEKMRPIGSQT